MIHSVESEPALQLCRSTTLTGQVPAGYSTPPFPSLWIPPDNITQVGSFLYYIQDIWRFTLLWTFIVYGAFHIFASIYAVSTQRQKLSYVWIVPVVFVVVAGIEALLAGSVVGLM